MPALCPLCKKHHLRTCAPMKTYEVLVTEVISTRVILQAVSSKAAIEQAVEQVVDPTFGYEQDSDGITSAKIINITN